MQIVTPRFAFRGTYRSATVTYFIDSFPYDDEIVVWFNYSDRTNPDDPNTDRRDFSLSETYSISVSSRFIIASIKIALR